MRDGLESRPKSTHVNIYMYRPLYPDSATQRGPTDAKFLTHIYLYYPESQIRFLNALKIFFEVFGRPVSSLESQTCLFANKEMKEMVIIF